MRRALLMTALLCLLALPARAADYTISAPGDPDYGGPTSMETVYTADGGERRNEDVSKNSALVPPPFGSPSADALNTGDPLTPNLAPDTMPAAGAVLGDSGPVYVPETPTTPTTQYTAVTGGLYYTGGHLGTLKIPSIGVNVKVYQGTDGAALAKGAGHFEETSIWSGNVALAGHNRGAHGIFGDLHTLRPGDRIVLTTKLGTRTYEVTSVSKVHETDRSGLAASTEDQITLYTCVRDQSAYRWCVRGKLV